MSKRLFTDREAAEYLGFSRAKIWLLMKEGKLASIKLGNSRRIEVSELDRFVNENAIAN
ncbi:helix-turn-helix domain-containing protein [Amylibacter sp. IMCC11727]|uniref:helix-turn-helix domain-containing protein n=1 Tax=Amylibacter sp. IMCC11727 TaxID=3039851 RepID=UPI00244E1F7E|nr:helix-turn-helix domain-containing protein [Amylibacter sp. IMCC11727]WGI22403.1 helix-turn-helix domain-containing protein [Amylibacter sp. IMCC11727]